MHSAKSSNLPSYAPCARPGVCSKGASLSEQMEREGATQTVPLFICYNMVCALHQEYVVIASEPFGTNSTVSGQMEREGAT